MVKQISIANTKAVKVSLHRMTFAGAPAGFPSTACDLCTSVHSPCSICRVHLFPQASLGGGAGDSAQLSTNSEADGGSGGGSRLISPLSTGGFINSASAVGRH